MHPSKNYLLPKEIKNKIDYIQTKRTLQRLLMLKRLPWQGRDKVTKAKLGEAWNHLIRFGRIMGWEKVSEEEKEE